MERSTRQRAAIIHVLEASGRPLSPRELLAAAREEVPGIGIATVYRAIAALVDDRAVHVVELPGNPHARAGRVGPPSSLSLPQVPPGVRRRRLPGGIAGVVPRGFRLDRHELVLYGTCRQCRAA